jgi:hypothetical protein
MARRGASAAPSQQRLCPRDQLAGAERLGDVVVRAEIQPEDDVLFLPLGRQHHDWHINPLATQRPAHVETVHLRQHDVEEDQIWLHGGGHVEAALPVAGDVHVESLRAQRIGQAAGQRRLVFDEQESPFAHAEACRSSSA